MISYNEREKAIRTLFDYEERNNIPNNDRYTYDQYADVPEISQVYPRKKINLDIRWVISRVNELKHLGKL